MLPLTSSARAPKDDEDGDTGGTTEEHEGPVEEEAGQDDLHDAEVADGHDQDFDQRAAA